MTLQLGQSGPQMCALTGAVRCGNQLGQELFNELHLEAQVAEKSFGEALRSVFFRDARSDVKALVARAVLVDTEPRVVQGCLQVSLKARKGNTVRPGRTGAMRSSRASTTLVVQPITGPGLQKELGKLAK